MLSGDPARQRRTSAPPQRRSLEYGIVGHYDPVAGLPEPNPQYVRIEQGQIWVEVTMEPSGDQIVARLALPDAGPQSGAYFGLKFGCRVILELIGGNPQNAVVAGRAHDLECAFPADVCGVQTGAAAAVAPGVSVPAPTWSFIKTEAGQLLALETGPGGDILIHAPAGNVSIAAAATVHVDAPQVHLGQGFTTPPVGGVVGPAGTEVPGVPGVPHVPAPATPPPPVAGPAPAIPYVGLAHSIIRAKDLYQSDISVDPVFWTFITGLYAHPLVGPILAAAGIVLPLSSASKASGAGGPGSLHTASDPTP